MQSILTQCPRCQTSFKVSDKQLAIAEGFVRCGSCLDVFSAMANRITIKQPASADPSEDYLEDDGEGDDETGAPTFEHKDEADSPIIQALINPAASAADSAAFDLSHSAPLKYPVSQLVDADDVIPVNVAAVTPASSFSHPDSGFVFDDDIPLGDMVLDDVDLNAGDEFENENDEPEATEEFDEEETILLELDADFAAEADSVSGAEDDAISDEEVNPGIADKVDALAAAEVEAVEESRPTEHANLEPPAAPSSTLAEAHAEDAGSIALPAANNATPESRQHPFNAADLKIFAEETVAELARGGSAIANEETVAGLEAGESAITTEQAVANPETDEAGFTPEQAAAGTEANESAFIKETPGSDPEADALFHSIYDTASSDGLEPTPGPDAARENQHAPINQEALYEVYVAGIPAEAGAEEPQEMLAQGFGATPDDDGSPDAADSFTANNSSQTDEFQVDSFSALAVAAADKTDELVDLPPEAPSRLKKEELRQYLAGLEDADALEPLPATTVDAFEAEPLTLEVSHSFRRYISTFGWFCLSLTLVAVFVFQLVAANLELMQKSPTYARYLPFFCGILDCPEPAPLTAGIQSLSSQDLLVRSHPRVPDALEVSFIFRNDAELPQPFPLVELSFRDSNRRLIANRLFEPEEYLPPELGVLDMMPARSSVQVMLELVDPGSEAVDYEIIFRDAARESLNNSAGAAGTP